jgi:hypothetical protein
MTANKAVQSKTYPGRRAVEVDLSEGNYTPATAARFFFVGGAGDVEIILVDDTTAVTQPSGDNQYHPLEVKTFVQTGTTATNILAYF